MAELEEAYGKEITEGRAAIYFKELRVYPIMEIEEAINRAIHEQDFFPPVSMLIRFIEEQREEKRNQWPIFSMTALEYKEEWPTVPPEKLQAIIKPLMDKWKIQEQLPEEERRKRREESRVKLEDQKRILKVEFGGNRV
ncbi:MAG: hypothetical protein ACE144_13930 [Thermodesulfobacteriota bacterium]